MSLPTQGAWIEIAKLYHVLAEGASRSLHRERGLKSGRSKDLIKITGSLPTQGAWIEIAWGIAYTAAYGSRSLHRERGLK